MVDCRCGASPSSSVRVRKLQVDPAEAWDRVARVARARRIRVQVGQPERQANGARCIPRDNFPVGRVRLRRVEWAHRCRLPRPGVQPHGRVGLRAVPVRGMNSEARRKGQ